MSRKYKCKYCNEYKEESIKLPTGRFCCYEHAIEFAKEKQKRDHDKIVRKKNSEASKKEKEDRKRLRKRKEALKTITEYKKEAQAAVNAYIRVRDHNKPCISCGCMSVSSFGGHRGASGWDAGHYRSRGAAAHLSFNVFNIHKQCVKCNQWKAGNVVDYRINLIKRIGVERVERIESNNSSRKFTKEYLIRIKKIFNKKTRLYKRFRNV